MSLPRIRLQRPRLRSLRNKLALLFFAITAAAFAIIYFYVVPELQSNLEREKLRDLSRAAAAARPALERLMGRRDVTASGIDRRVRAVSDSAGARVTLLGIQQSSGAKAGELPEYIISDSREERSAPVNADLTAQAVLTDRSHTGYIHFSGERLGQVAQPLQYRGRADWVALYSRSFADVSETVALVRKRVLEAGVAALLIALVGGYLVAQALARRVRRLERGARAVAAGRFIHPLPVDSEDELGTLTRAFNDMQQKLRQVDVARKDFIATASHELRTPIFSLAGFVELLQDEELDEHTRREFIEAMAEQVARLQKLSVDLLDLSRLDAGSVQLQREQMDLSEVARSVVDEFTPSLVQHRTELRMRLPDAGIEATGDPERVAQIMRILLDNALRHTPEGTPVTVTAQRDNGAAEITVADAGPGLSAEAVPHVFDRFYTADATRGAGLGLAIARELAERMEGRLALAARPGRTAFTLELPTGGDGATS
jgi:two-component system, OmpR family, sensor kinase